MPKDPPRNQPNYKIGGDHINEYEYQNNSGAITEDEKHLPRRKEDIEGAELSKEENPHEEASGAAGEKTNAQNNS
jgi:hypothetical protein